MLQTASAPPTPRADAGRLTAADVMSSPVVTVREDESVREAAGKMLRHGLGALPVVSAAGAPIGMASDGDLLGARQRDPRREWWFDLFGDGSECIVRPRFIDGRAVREAMSAPLITISPRTPVAEIAVLIRLNHVKRLPVVADSALVGIVSRTDLTGLVETLTPPKDAKAGYGLVEFLEGLIGGASLRGLAPHTPPAQMVAATPRPSVFTAKALRKQAETYEAGRQSQIESDRTVARLKRQGEVKALLQAHVDEALWRDLIGHAKAAAARGEIEMQLLQFPCALCTDGGRMIDVAEPGWESSLRGEPAELYARWRNDLKAAGFGISARIVGYDEQGAIGQAGLFLTWGATP